jgi:hypothetical protein
MMLFFKKNSRTLDFADQAKRMTDPDLLSIKGRGLAVGKPALSSAHYDMRMRLYPWTVHGRLRRCLMRTGVKKSTTYDDLLAAD